MHSQQQTKRVRVSRQDLAHSNNTCLPYFAASCQRDSLCKGPPFKQQPMTTQTAVASDTDKQTPLQELRCNLAHLENTLRFGQATTASLASLLAPLATLASQARDVPSPNSRASNDNAKQKIVQHFAALTE
eukprot:6341656-Amphidinium_carterae.4